MSILPDVIDYIKLNLAQGVPKRKVKQGYTQKL
jgi:hypothetical protein